MKIDKKDLLIYSAFAFITLFFFYPFLDGSKIFGFKDLSRYFYPLRQLMVEQVKSGIIPLWNPYLFCGYPFLATLQIGFFYPLSLIYYILPFHLAFNYYTIIHYFLAAVFMYYLMRHYKASRYASFFSGIVFAYSGYLVSVANMNTTLSSVVWLPLVILFYDKLIKSTNNLQLTTNGLKIIFVLAFMFLGGEPTIVYTTILVLFTYGLIFGNANKYKNTLFLIASVIIAMGITAVQLLPFIELIRYSDRASGADFKIISMRSFPVRETINFILPYFWGNSTAAGSYSKALLGEKMQDWLISPYFGLVPLLFAGFSLIKADKRIKFFLFSGLFGLILSFGIYTPAYQFFYKFLPGISYIRYPIKYIYITVFSLALLGGFGFQKFCESVENAKKIALGLFGGAFALGVLFVMAEHFKVKLINIMLVNCPAALNAFQKLKLSDNLNFNLQSIINLSGIMIFLGLIVLLFSAKRIKPNLFILMVFAIMIFDLFSVNIPINIPVDRIIQNAAITPNLALIIKDKDLFRYCLTKKLMEHNHTIFGDDYDHALLEMKDKFAPNRILPLHLYDFDGYESILLESHRQLNQNLDKMDLEERLKTIGSLNVKYIISLLPLKSDSLKLISHNRAFFYGQTYIYLNKYWMPRAYMTGADVKIEEYQSDHVVISAKAGKKGYLYLSDSYYSGWRAYVDGSEKEIVKANYQFRSVFLDAGSHRVEFQYKPFLFTIGSIISIIMLIVSLGTVILLIRIKRKNRYE